MSTAWLDRSEVERILRLEAGGTATQLGHRIGTWETRAGEGVSIARCLDCGETAAVAVRRFRKSPISGAAVALRCTGHRTGDRVAAQRSPAFTR